MNVQRPNISLRTFLKTEFEGEIAEVKRDSDTFAIFKYLQ